MTDQTLRSLSKTTNHFLILLKEGKETKNMERDFWTIMEENLNPESKIAWFTGTQKN